MGGTGTGGGSGFNWQGTISSLMQLAGAGITANRGALGPILMMGGQMMAKNQEYKRLSALATESAGSIGGTPEAEQIQNLIRNRQLENPEQIEKLTERGRGTLATRALPRILGDVTTQERIPTPPGTIEGVPVEWKDLREKLAPEERPGEPTKYPTLTVTPDEMRTTTRPVTRQQALDRIKEEQDPAVRDRLIAAVAGGRFPETDPLASARREFEHDASSGKYDLSTTAGTVAAYKDAVRKGRGAVEAFSQYSNLSPAAMGKLMQEEERGAQYRKVEVPTARRRIEEMQRQQYPEDVLGYVRGAIDNLEGDPTEANKKALDAALKDAGWMNAKAKQAEAFDRRFNERLTQTEAIADLRARRADREDLIKNLRADEAAITKDLILEPDDIKRRVLTAEKDAKKGLREDLERRQATDAQDEGAAPPGTPAGRKFRQTPSGALVPVP